MTESSMQKAVKSLQDYWNTYDEQIGYETYSLNTLIHDALYGLGIAIDEKQFQYADGYRKFKAILIDHINDIEENSRTKTEMLKRCPCGEIPTDLSVTDAGQGGKWACVSGNCCGEWTIEFRTEYYPIESEECKSLAFDAWNGAPRAGD